MNIKLTEAENKVYLKIIKLGTMDDMFEIGYAIGRERAATENLRMLEELKTKE